jgi:hypothetical protein
MKRCAVVGCEQPGRPHICPHDGRYHHHGRVHYDSGCPKHSLDFRDDGWHLLCDEHFAIVKSEREAWESSSLDRV